MTASEQDDVEQGLRHLMSRELPEARDIRIEGLTRISEGYSRENWIFDGAWTADDETVKMPLILRRDPVGSLLETDRRTEFDMMQALSGSQLPLAEVLWMDEEGALLGRPSVVMKRVSGDVEWYLLNSDRSLEERLDLARRLVSLLAQIHSLDWRALGLDKVLRDPGLMASMAELDVWEDQLRRNQLEPHPELELALAWLRARAPASQATVVVHGDFKPGNALLEDGQITAMLDWELAHLGDPLEDLGWITNPYRRREHQIRGEWGRHEIVAHYTSESGFEVRDEELYWWNVFSCFKSAVIMLNGMAAFMKGQFDVIFQIPTKLYRVMFDLMDEVD